MASCDLPSPISCLTCMDCGPGTANDCKRQRQPLRYSLHLPLLKVYAQICFCFSVVGASSHPAIIKTLTDGLERLYANLSMASRSGHYRRLKGKGFGRLQVPATGKKSSSGREDPRHDPSMSTMDALRQANFPIRMLVR